MDGTSAFAFNKWRDVSVKEPVKQSQAHGAGYEEDMMVYISGKMIGYFFRSGRPRVKQINS